MSKPMASLAAIILTKNEAPHIKRAILSLNGLADQVFVVDSGSDDNTVEIAQSVGAIVVYNPWISHAAQFQWALNTLPLNADWVMRLDADEIIEPDLANNLKSNLKTVGADICGIILNRKHIFMGRWIAHGGRYPLQLLRIWRLGTARVEQKWMDEHMLLTRGKAIYVKGGFADVNLSPLTDFISKHNKYATLEAIEVLTQKYMLFPKEDGVANGGPRQAAGKRRIKDGLYRKLPFGYGPLLYFLYRYFYKLGFLDGKEGTIYHFLQGFWYRYLVDAKIVEFDRKIDSRSDIQDKIRALSDVSGIDLSKR
jgi:glycosyltransferase involved in cell wall biosynthesis